MGIRSAFRELWHVLSSKGEGLNRSTRYVLSVLSFLVITVVMIIAFGFALHTTSDLRFTVLIDLVTHLSYVLASCVGVYIGAASMFPSQSGYGFAETTTAWFRKRKLEQQPQDSTPPAPNEGDVEVD